MKTEQDARAVLAKEFLLVMLAGHIPALEVSSQVVASAFGVADAFIAECQAETKPS